MRYAELVQLYFQQSDTLQTYWTVYVVVIGGLLAVAALRTEPDRLGGVLATILYCAFAYKNMGAIRDLTQTREATLTTLQQFDSTAAFPADLSGIHEFQQKILPTLHGTPADGVKSFHITCDAITIVTLWSLQWRRRRAKRVRDARGGM